MHAAIPHFRRGAQRIFHKRPGLRRHFVVAFAERRQHERRRPLRRIREDVQQEIIREIRQLALFAIDSRFEFRVLCNRLDGLLRLQRIQHFFEIIDVVAFRQTEQPLHGRLQCGTSDKLFGRRRLHTRRTGQSHRAAIQIQHRHTRIFNRLARTFQMLRQQIRRIVEQQENRAAAVQRFRDRS